MLNHAPSAVELYEDLYDSDFVLTEFVYSRGKTHGLNEVNIDIGKVLFSSWYKNSFYEETPAIHASQ